MERIRSLNKATFIGPILQCMVFLRFAQAQSSTFDTPGGPVTVEHSHVGPRGSLRAPSPPEATAFRPPSLFSAPLPSGSGARALGLAGAFTAVADDATAASWNPAGLIQLERPEISSVIRYSRENDRHRSSDAGFRVGEDDFDHTTLNYFSVVYPFYVPRLSRNMVASLNFQEAYDFTLFFTAKPSDLSSSSRDRLTGQTFVESEVQALTQGIVDLTVSSITTTRVVSALGQLFSSGLVSDLKFKQEGVISALTPAWAIELTPALSFGLAFNYYHLDPISGDSIRSRTLVNYAGSSTNLVNATTTRTTSGSFTYEGVAHLPGDPGLGIPPSDEAFSNSTGVVFGPFVGTEHTRSRDEFRVQGTFEEINEFTNLNGFNANLGLLWTVSKMVSLGASVDLPWTAEAKQKADNTKYH